MTDSYEVFHSLPDEADRWEAAVGGEADAATKDRVSGGITTKPTEPLGATTVTIGNRAVKIEDMELNETARGIL